MISHNTNNRFIVRPADVNPLTAYDFRVTGQFTLKVNNFYHQIHKEIEPMNCCSGQYQAFIPQIPAFEMNQLML